MTEFAPIAFTNTFAKLPPRFFDRQAPVPVRDPKLIRVNHALAEAMGLNPSDLESEPGVAVLAGNVIPDGADPLAMAYAGHQFGGWVPQLGDGRAILLGEHKGRDGIGRDIQLKGSGRTAFSRSGDGRAWLGPVLREYVVSEAMAALGIPTTRALAAVSTGETVQRETALPGAILTRVARAHVRVGTFQYFAARQDLDGLRVLADYAISRLYPDLRSADCPYRALLQQVTDRQADLIARWMSVGFIHGVMNTDNVSIAGETIDYGPCAFMEHFHPETVFSSIDHMERYAWINQPGIAQWNLAQFAGTLLPLMEDDPDRAVEDAQAIIDGFTGAYGAAYLRHMGPKIGIADLREDDGDLIVALLAQMTESRADFTNTFRNLDLFAARDDMTEWAARWRDALTRYDVADPASVMNAANPAVIPRNHRVEAMINAAVAGDFGPFETLNRVLTLPYHLSPGDASFADAPLASEVVERTFCGT